MAGGGFEGSYLRRGAAWRLGVEISGRREGVSDLEPWLVNAKLQRVLYGRLSEVGLAELLLMLTDGAEAWLATTIWNKTRREVTHRVLVTDASQPLAGRDDSGRAKLALQDPLRVRRLRLMVFYRDGSILWSELGSQDTITVVRGDEESEAAMRTVAAKNLVDRHAHPTRDRVAAASLIAGPVVGAFVMVRWPNSLLPTLLGASLILACLLAFVWMTPRLAAGSVLPRERKMLRLVTSLEWSKADVRNAIVGGVFLIVGLVIGSLVNGS